MHNIILWLLKIVIMLACTLTLIFVTSFFIYDALVFQPKYQEITQLIESAPLEDQAPPELVKKYLLLAEHNRSANYSTRLLVMQAYPTHSSTFVWHLRHVLWQLLIKLHLSMDEELRVISVFCCAGKDRGLSALSYRLFNRPLSALNESEAAELSVTLKAPSIYEKYSERRLQARDLLLEKAVKQ